ncbi:MAG: ribonuclease P protein component [Thermoflexales bacterium]|nr:ribonuclease P protein component [Thermoflexales bacterium]
MEVRLIGRRLGSPLPGRFPRWARMRHKADFEQLRSRGQSWRHALFVLTACRNDREWVRIGVVASKKIGKAAKRNRARRLLREAARLAYHQLAPGWDIVLIARPAISEARVQQVYAGLVQVTQQAGLLGDQGVHTT